MTIDNSSKAISIKKWDLLYIIILISVLIVALVGLSYNWSFLGFNKYHLVCILVATYLGITIYRYFLNYQYLFFSDEAQKMDIRYYSLRGFKSKRHAIEIPKSSFVKAEIKSSFFKLKAEIFFYQRMTKGIAKYPGISLSAYNENQRKQLELYLAMLAERMKE